MQDYKHQLAEQVARGDVEAEVKLDWYFGHPPAPIAIPEDYLKRRVASIRLARSAKVGA